MRSDPAALAARLIPGVGVPQIRLLRSGLVNATYQVQRDGRVYALRLASAGASSTDREWECRVLARAAEAGLAPTVRHCEPAAGILVSDWIQGRGLGPHDTEGAGVARMAGLMRRIHSLEAPQPVRAVTPADWVAHYAALLQGAGPGGQAESTAASPEAAAAALRLRQAADQRLRILAQQPAPRTVLCHGDLHRLNLVASGDSCVVLDWEYSHVTDPYWDLASWSSSNDWGAATRLELLRAYGDADPTSAQCLRFDLLAWLYDYVCLAWSGLYPRLPGGAGTAGGEAAAVAGRARLLAARLEAYPVVAQANLRQTTRPGGNNGDLNGADDRGGSRR